MVRPSRERSNAPARKLSHGALPEYSNGVGCHRRKYQGILEIQAIWAAVATALRAPRDLLLHAGEIFRGDRPLEPVALLQTLRVGGDVGPEILGKPDIFRKPQRVSDHDIGRREPVGTQRFGVAGSGFDDP